MNGKFVPRVKPKEDPDEAPPNFYAIFAFLAGFLTNFTKIKIGAWVTLLLLCMTLANLKPRGNEWMPVILAVISTVGAFVSTYLAPRAA